MPYISIIKEDPINFRKKWNTSLTNKLSRSLSFQRSYTSITFYKMIAPNLHTSPWQGLHFFQKCKTSLLTNRRFVTCTILHTSPTVTDIPYKHPYLQIEDLYDVSTGMFVSLVWDVKVMSYKSSICKSVRDKEICNLYNSSYITKYHTNLGFVSLWSLYIISLSV